ncbi:MAG: glycosyltransferase family 2 protein [Alphaproteobacteria bacterium]|nr:glycosyltransferase family 2 protein [Alphaproteobacteria bacterium]
MPLFSAVICTFNRYDLLPRAIESLRMQTIAADDYDIWIMDNSPASDQRKAFAQRYANIPNLYYAEVDRPGLSNARNLAAQHAKGEIIVYLDDDAVAVPTLLQEYKTAFTQLNAAVIGGKVLPDFAIPKPSWLDDRLLTYLSLCNFGDETKLLIGSDEPVGANIAFNRAILLQSGGFNPSLGRLGMDTHNLLSGEESDCQRRIKSMGHAVGYAPNAQAIHTIPASRLTHAWFRKRSAWQATSDQMLYTLNDNAIAIFKGAIEHYVKQVPAEHAATMGFVWDTQDPDLFFRQINAIGMFTRLMLAKGDMNA